MTATAHRRLVSTVFAAFSVLVAFLGVRMMGFLPLYTDPFARAGFSQAMSALRNDTGWGASAFDVRSVACTGEACTAEIDFRYRANPSARREERGWILKWPKARPADYVLER